MPDRLVATQPIPMTAEPDKPKPRRRWLQFSLRTLLLLMTASAIAIAWFLNPRPNVAVAEIERLGGSVQYRFPWEDGEEPIYARWLRPTSRNVRFGTVVSVTLDGRRVNDETLRVFEHLPDLQYITLVDTSVSEEGLLQLQHHRQLTGISLFGSQKGDKLREKRPDMFIHGW